MMIPREPSICILGSTIHLASVSRTVDCIEDWIAEPLDGCHRIVVSGFHGIWEAFQNPLTRRIFDSADLWVPDGIAPVWVARIRRYKNVERSPGAEIMQDFLQRADKRRYRSYFYGDTKETLTALQSTLSTKYPGHEIAGAYSPPFRTLTPDEDAHVIEQINAMRPDVLWVGLGLPKQEHWIYERRDQLKVPVVIGVGAAFGFLAGTVPRCPRWLGSMGFEWIYRFLKEPKKLWRRDILDGPRFLFYLALELMRDEQFASDRTDSRGA